MTDDINREMKRKVKRRYNRATGKHEDVGHKMDTTQWWKDKLSGQSVNTKRQKKLKEQMKEHGG